MTPDPVPIGYLRALCEQAGGVVLTSRLLRVNERTVRRWLDGSVPVSWGAAELLASYLEARVPNLTATPNEST